MRFHPVLAHTAGLAILLASQSCQPSTPDPAVSGRPRARFPKTVWQYPGAKPIGELKGGSVAGGKNGEKQPLALATSLYSSTTADSIEKVWGHYAKLAGIKTAFAPGAISGGSDSAASVGSEHATGTFEGVAYYTGDAARVSARTATIAAQNPDFTATVFLVQVQGESRTDITLVVGENP